MAMAKGRARKTTPGRVIRNMGQLEKALAQPAIYMNGRNQASAFLRGMTFHTLQLFVRGGRLRFARYEHEGQW